MNYNPKIHNRQSIRLKGYDYSREGLYFITICCQDQAMMFGEIKNGEMYLNDAGRMVEKWYWEMENKYPDKKCREMVVMPNHFHCIIENVKTDEYGDDGMDAPPYTSAPPRIDAHVGTSLRGRPDSTNDGGRPEQTNEGGVPNQRATMGVPNQRANVGVPNQQKIQEI